MKIHGHQHDEFHKLSNERFATRVAWLIRADYPLETAGLGERELLGRVLHGIGRAHDYGLTQDRDVLAIVCLTFGVSPTFDLHEPFRHLLTDTAIPPAERLDLLFARARTEDWQAAAAQQAG